MRTSLIILFALMVCKTSHAQTTSNNMGSFGLALHGGAGTITKNNMTPEKERAYFEKLGEALDKGYAILSKGGTSLDAVEEVVKILEDSPLFNAGKGSVYTNDLKQEMDASIMDGKTLMAGSVASVRTIKNPVSAARAVMEKSQHVLMVGKGAENFAKEKGVEIVDTSYFFDEFRFRQLEKIKDSEKIKLDHSEDKGGNFPEEHDNKFGTVGAVALDKYGNMAAATSTGGMTNKKFGRVGDSPIIGAGIYANNKTCAVSCTGHGEYFIRSVAAYDVSARMEYKRIGIAEAASEVIHEKLTDLGGTGGLIAIDSKGNVAMPFNTEGMYRGFITDKGKKEILIYK